MNLDMELHKTSVTTMTIQSIPDAYHRAKPYFIVNGGVSAIAFYKTAFDTTELVVWQSRAGR